MESVKFTRSGDLAQITINRPARRNALTAQDWLSLRDAAREAATCEARAVVIRGADGAFSAGFDLSELELGHVDAEDLILGHVNPALEAVRDIAVPTVAAVEGSCVGGGFGIAAACDIILASETANFAVPYMKIGIMVDAGLHNFLLEAVGYHRAADLIFTGRSFSAVAALAYGLCTDVVAADDFEDRLEALCESLASGPTQALVRSKSILRSGANLKESMAMEARLQHEVFATKDAVEGVGAFLEGRAPRFSGQ